MDVFEHISANIPIEWQHYDAIDSTNLAALRYVRGVHDTRYKVQSQKVFECDDSLLSSSKNESDCSLRLIISADEQTQGRGRLERQWVSKHNQGIYVSFVCTIAREFFERNGTWISTVAGLSARDAVHDLMGVDVQLKWPNDLYVDDCKLGGILCESVNSHNANVVSVVIGIGINSVSSPNLDALHGDSLTAGSLHAPLQNVDLSNVNASQTSSSSVAYSAISLAQCVDADRWSTIYPNQLHAFHQALIARIACNIQAQLSGFTVHNIRQQAIEHSATLGRMVYVQCADGRQLCGYARDIAYDASLEVEPEEVSEGAPEETLAQEETSNEKSALRHSGASTIFVSVGDVTHARLARK
ncbi:biotin--[acetyl-CoA-carboxylase] ligase [Alloscardovia omnicolens]|uniref:biotin--[acetyl-CoA-carboxylase] ligase n=1 Tax=Alloscardovia omnicolens TaxID=419015 RepID=UPI003A5DDDF4